MSDSPFTLQQREALARIFAENSYTLEGLKVFCESQADYYRKNTVSKMMSIPPSSDEAIQNAAMARTYESFVDTLKEHCR